MQKRKSANPALCVWLFRNTYTITPWGILGHKVVLLVTKQSGPRGLLLTQTPVCRPPGNNSQSSGVSNTTANHILPIFTLRLSFWYREEVGQETTAEGSFELFFFCLTWVCLDPFFCNLMENKVPLMQKTLHLYYYKYILLLKAWFFIANVVSDVSP